MSLARKISLISILAAGCLSAQVPDSLLKFELRFDYDTFEQPLKDIYEFSPVGSADLFRLGKKRYPVFRLEAAGAYPWAADAELDVRPVLGEKFGFALKGAHHSYWGRLWGQDTLLYAPGMRNAVGADISYVWKKGELHASGGWDHNKYDFTYQRASAALSARSVNASPTSFLWRADASYQHYSLFGDLRCPQNRGQVDIALGAVIAGKHKVYVEIGADVSGSVIGGRDSVTYSFSLSPQYRFETDRLKLRAGIGLVYAGPDTAPPGQIHPLINVEFETVRDRLWVYAAVTGEYRRLSLWDLTELCPRMDYAVPQLDARTPVRGRIGLNGRVGGVFSYNAYASLERSYYLCTYGEEDRPLQVIPVIAGDDFLSTGLDFSLDVRGFTADGEFRYLRSLWNRNGRLVGKPSFAAALNLGYNVRQRLFFNLDSHFESECRRGAAFTAPWFVNLNFRVTYMFNPRVSIYIQGSNLLNMKIYRYGALSEPGAGGKIALTLSL